MGASSTDSSYVNNVSPALVKPPYIAFFGAGASRRLIPEVISIVTLLFSFMKQRNMKEPVEMEGRVTTVVLWVAKRNYCGCRVPGVELHLKEHMNLSLGSHKLPHLDRIKKMPPRVPTRASRR